MTIYEYSCPFCKIKINLKQSMLEEHKAQCPECMGEMKQVYSFSFVISDKKRKKELTGWRKRVF